MSAGIIVLAAAIAIVAFFAWMGLVSSLLLRLYEAAEGRGGFHVVGLAYGACVGLFFVAAIVGAVYAFAGVALVRGVVYGG